MKDGNDIVERLREWLYENPACMEAADEIERLRSAIDTVVKAFEASERAGYKSRDRQFALSILRDMLAQKEQAE